MDLLHTQSILQDAASDKHTVDLRGTVVDASHPRVPCNALQRKILAIAHATEDLDSAVGDAAKHFLAMEIAGLRYALSHREESLKLTQRLTEAKPDDPRAAYLYDDTVRSGAVDPEMPIPMDKIAWMQDLLVKSGDLSNPGDVQRMVDPVPRQQALELIGR